MTTIAHPEQHLVVDTLRYLDLHLGVFHGDAVALARLALHREKARAEALLAYAVSVVALTGALALRAEHILARLLDPLAITSSANNKTLVEYCLLRASHSLSEVDGHVEHNIGAFHLANAKAGHAGVRSRARRLLVLAQNILI